LWRHFNYFLAEQPAFPWSLDVYGSSSGIQRLARNELVASAFGRFLRARPESFDRKLIDPLQRVPAPFGGGFAGFKLRRNLKNLAVQSSDFDLDQANSSFYLNEFPVECDPVYFPITNTKCGGLCKEKFLDSLPIGWAREHRKQYTGSVVFNLDRRKERVESPCF
jgi:hypothetical protein